MSLAFYDPALEEGFRRCGVVTLACSWVSLSAALQLTDPALEGGFKRCGGLCCIGAGFLPAAAVSRWHVRTQVPCAAAHEDRSLFLRYGIIHLVPDLFPHSSHRRVAHPRFGCGSCGACLPVHSTGM